MWGRILCFFGMHRWDTQAQCLYFNGTPYGIFTSFACYRCHCPRMQYQGYDGRWYWEG